MSENEEKTVTEAAEAEAVETEPTVETETSDEQAADDAKAEDKAEEQAEDKAEAQAEDEAGEGETEAPNETEDAAAAGAEDDESEETEQEAAGESAGEEPQAEEPQAGESQAGESQDEKSDAEDSKVGESKAGDSEAGDSEAGDSKVDDSKVGDSKVEGKDSGSEGEADEKKAQKEAKSKAPVEPLSPEIAALDEARKKRQPVSGKVIGWNKGGFHVVLGDVPAFCPRSTISLGEPDEPESYLNRELDFTVLEIRKGGKRIVVSRAGAIRAERSAKRKATMAEVKPGAVLTGTVVSLTDFGAFIDLGGVQGLLHVSEISRSRVEHPSDVFEEGQEVEVKVLKVEKRGKRISLSCKALEPDPWQAIDEFTEGQEVDGRVERAERFGVLVELAPGLSGLIPSSKLSLPADAQPQRVFPKGKELTVQIVSIDKKRKRISLLPEGAQVDGSKKDLEEYRKEQGDQKLGAMAAAFERAQSKNR